MHRLHGYKVIFMAFCQCAPVCVNANVCLAVRVCKCTLMFPHYKGGTLIAVHLSKGSQKSDSSW